MYKLVAFAAVIAAAQAGLAPVAYSYGYGPVASTAIGASSQSTLRSLDGSQVVSQYSKAVDTAFSSVRKHDTRITNDAQYLAPIAHAAPLAYAAAPAIAHAAVPVAHASPLAYAAAPVAHAAAPVVGAGLLGVAYSAAPAVSHIDFSGYGVHYGW